MQDAATGNDHTNAVFMILLELDTPFLYNIPKEQYETLQKLLLSAKDIFWVIFASGTDSGLPEFSIAHGIARALRSEYEELEFTIVSLEAHEELSEEQCRNVLRILVAKHINHSRELNDTEYLEIGGALCIPRMIPSFNLSSELNVRYSKQQNSIIRVRDAPPLSVDLLTPGLLDTLRFVEYQWTQDVLQPDEIEVEVKAIGLTSGTVWLHWDNCPMLLLVKNVQALWFNQRPHYSKEATTSSLLEWEDSRQC